MLWPCLGTGDNDFMRTISEHDGTEETRALNKAQTLVTAARSYVSMKTLIRREALKEGGSALHMWLSFGPTHATKTKAIRSRK